MPNPSPPQQPPQLPHQPPFSKPTTFPDFLLTALSLFLFITTPKHHHNHLPHPLPLHHHFTTSTRRFLRLTATSSHSPMSHHHKTPLFFPTPQALSDWLKPRLPTETFALWGRKPGTKNIHNLWLELHDGESYLQERDPVSYIEGEDSQHSLFFPCGTINPLIRTLEVVCVNIKNKDNNQQLLEFQQELSDGSVRIRNRPLSEKLKADEDVLTGAKRAIKEELGGVIKENFDEVVKVDMGTYSKKVEERNSVSYPGLPACYVLHNVDAFVEGLPDGEFVTEEGDEYVGCDHGVADAAVAVKKHFWKWVDVDNV